MTVSSKFGQIIIASQIEEATTKTLQKWFPTYLAEVARQVGISRNSLPQPQNYTNRNSFDTQKGEPVPKIVVLAPGLTGTPTQQGQGSYTAIWRLGVGVAASGKDEQSANLRVKAYGGAIRAIMLQQQDLGDLIPGIAGITWQDEAYEDIPILNQHQLFKGASLWFHVDVENVVSRWSGPDEPDIEPVDWPEVQEVDVDVEYATYSEILRGGD